MEDAIEVPTPKLLDEETRIAQEKRARISLVALEIDNILIREDLTVGDLLEIFNLFTSRINNVVSAIKVQEIKNRFDIR